MRPLELLVTAGMLQEGERLHYRSKDGEIKLYGTLQYVAYVDGHVHVHLTGDTRFCATSATSWWGALNSKSVLGRHCDVRPSLSSPRRGARCRHVVYYPFFFPTVSTYRSLWRRRVRWVVELAHMLWTAVST